MTSAAAANKPFVSRSVAKQAPALETMEGAGVLVRRSIGTQQIRNFDPFLLLDEMNSEGGPGFPDHPHRGIETVTYMLPDSKGAFHHEDSAGNSGTLGAGALQWMTAGRGVMHSEMPASQLACHGLQLWVNLAAKNKMVAPHYQDLPSERVPEAVADGVKVRVIAGTALGVTSPVKNSTPVHYLHYTLSPNAVVRQPIPAGWNAFVFTLRGFGRFGSSALTGPYTTLLLTPGGDGLQATAGSDGDCEFLLISGQPLNEPTVQHGPFVMNTREEIQQAFEDFYQFKNGFETARGWRSKYGNM